MFKTAALALIAAPFLLAATQDTASPAGRYATEIDVAMDRMMADMHVAPSGDIDADFVAMMEPHHQGAIDMAVAQLRYGKNPQLKRIAQEIIIEQQQEIAAMRLAVGKPLPPSQAAPTDGALQPSPAPAPLHGDH